MGGSSPQQQPTQTTQTNLSPQAQQLFNLALPNIEKYAAGPPPERYPGSTVAPFNQYQQLAQSLALDTAPQQQGLARWGSNVAMSSVADQQRGLPTGQTTPVAAAPGAWQGAEAWSAPGSVAQSSNIFSDPGIWDPRANAGLSQAITAAQRPTWQALTENALPVIRDTAITTGPFGGSRQGIAEGLATSRATTAAGDIAAKMANDQYAANLAAVNQRYNTNIGAGVTQRGQDISGSTTARGQDIGAATTARGQDVTARGQDVTQQGQQLDYLGRQYGQNQAATYQALGLLPSLQQAYATPAGTVGAVGDAQQQMSQAQLNDAVAAWNYQQTAPYAQSRDIMGLLAATPGQTTTSTGNVPQANPWMQALGGAAAGASIGSAIPFIGAPIGAGAGALMPFLFK